MGSGMDYFFAIDVGDRCPLRGLTVSVDATWVQGVRFVLKEQLGEGAAALPTPLHKEAQAQIEAYLAGRLKEFDLPIHPIGTPFQQQVWAQMQKIPFGETCTYGEVGVDLGDVHLARAVGNAANKNPLPLLIPCHRVVGKGGRLTGFACGTATKAFLLDLERNNIKS